MQLLRFEKDQTNLFQFKTVWKLSPGFQIAAIAVLYLLITTYSWLDVQKTGLMYGYPIHVSLLFAPIYEEIIFRGLILMTLLKHYSATRSIVVSSLLFGLWHLKNVFYLDTDHLIQQLIYTTFFFGPVTAWLALKLKTLWPGIIIHYLNNLLAPFSLVLINLLLR